MAEKQILIEKAEPLLLFGFNDVHLRRLEDAFPKTAITARGNQIFLKGEEVSLGRIERILDEMTVLVNRNGQLTHNDIDTILALSASGGGSGQPDARHAVVFTPSGGVIRAKTPHQVELVQSLRTHDIVFAVGPAGTGKTYTAVALAVAALKSKQATRIVLCRPAVEAGERLGFLPGDFREKIDPYLRPLYDALEDMLSREKLTALMEQNIVEIAPLAYMRGRTLNSAFAILDEAQNATSSQMKMFLTRLGANSRAIITGDVTQSDLPRPRESGLVRASQILEGVEGIGFVHFDEGDVIRHKLVKDIIRAYQKYDQEN